MMVRPLMEKDRERIKELQGEHEWQLGPDFVGGYAYVDANDMPVLVVGGWKKVETHMLVDSQWGTPGARMLALQACHAVTERSLYKSGYREAITYFPKIEKFCRRMRQLGWAQTLMTTWHREVTNG